MKLKKLIVQGFKSFKDRTTINFNQGITGIVGPNGCGKSNVVDALFWVMGEMSAKQLRGTSMKDVIFNGSSKYAPSAWAEVSLVLDNEELKHIHIGTQVLNPAEIQLTRKLYRNGETEYRINGTPCRLKDIHEVFMDTGAGANSYSVIAQGEIGHLIQAKPEERREMIEEVAGVTKFKVRKKESLRKIELTEQNLARINDLKSEIEKNLRSLGHQAQIAEKAVTLREKIKDTELRAESNRAYQCYADILAANKFLHEAQLNLANWKARKDIVATSLETERQQAAEYERGVEVKQKLYHDQSTMLASASTKAEFLAKSVEDKKQQIAARETELTETAALLADLQTRLTTLEEERANLAQQASAGAQLAAAKEHLENSRQSLLTEELNTANKKRIWDDGLSNLRNLEQEIFRNSTQLEESSHQLQDINAEIESIEQKFSQGQQDLDKERQQVQELQDAALRAQQDLQAGEQQLKDLAERLKQQQASYQSAYQAQVECQAQVKSLQELTAVAGSNAAEEFLQDTAGTDYKLLGNLIRCEDAYTPAVQAILGDLLESLIPPALDDDGESFHRWFSAQTKKSGQGLFARAGQEVLGLNDAALPAALAAQFALVTPLEQVVQIKDEAAAAILKPYLKRFFIIGDLAPEKVAALAPHLRFTLVAADGLSLVSQDENGIRWRYGESTNAAAFLVARNNELASLETRLATAGQELAAQSKALEEVTQAYNTQEQQVVAFRAQAQEQQTSFIRLKAQVENKANQYDLSTTRLGILKDRKDEVSRARLTYLEKDEQLRPQLIDLRATIKAQESEFQAQQERFLQIKSAFEKEKEEVFREEVQAQTWAKRVQDVENHLKDIVQQIARDEQKQNSNRDLIAQYTQENEQAAQEIEQLNGEISHLTEKVRLAEGELQALKETWRQLTNAMAEREEEERQLGQSINKTEKEEVEQRLKFEQNVELEAQISQNIFEKYRVDLRKLAQQLNYTEEDFGLLRDLQAMYFMETEQGPQRIVSTPYEFNPMEKAELAKALERLRRYKSEYAELGDINWQAIEDYEKQKLRFNFLQDQEKELRVSLDDLQNAINQIDARAKARFKSAFEEVNERFEKVFPIIFGGGMAQLKLTSHFEDPECGIDIIARPPGKKMQNINLMSGGEKAMTAVALIFSIFLVRPSPFCLLDEVDAPLDDANVDRFNQLLREMSRDSQFILITHNKKTMEMNDTLYGITMQEPGISKAISVQLH